MERSIKCKPNNLCIAIFTLCLSVRFIEYFLIETDQTVVGENVLHIFAKWCGRIANCPGYGCINYFLCFCVGNLLLREQTGR